MDLRGETQRKPKYGHQEIREREAEELYSRFFQQPDSFDVVRLDKGDQAMNLVYSPEAGKF